MQTTNVLIATATAATHAFCIRAARPRHTTTFSVAMKCSCVAASFALIVYVWSWWTLFAVDTSDCIVQQFEYNRTLVPLGMDGIDCDAVVYVQKTTETIHSNCGTDIVSGVLPVVNSTATCFQYPWSGWMLDGFVPFLIASLIASSGILFVVVVLGCRLRHGMRCHPRADARFTEMTETAA